MSTRRSCPRLAALISTPPSSRGAGRTRLAACFLTRRSIRSVPSGPSIARTWRRATMARLADIEGGQGCEKIETEADGVPVVGAGLPRTGQGAGRDEVGGKLMGADDPVPPLLQQHHGARAEPDRRPRRDDFLHLLHVPQQRIGAEQRREAGPAHGADEGDGLRPPPFEGAHDGLEVEEIDGGVGAAAAARPPRSRGTPGHGTPVPSARDDSRVGWEAARPRRGSRSGLAGHQATEPTGSRGVQIARSLPSRMKSRISCTKGWSSNSPATSSTRSDNVPSSANSRR